MAAVLLYNDTNQDNTKSPYYDGKSGLSREDYQKRLEFSTTLYIRNLNHQTQEGQVLALFSLCGKVKKLHMGLNMKTKLPCGFCFVEFYTREEAKVAIDSLNLTTFDGNNIRVDWDYGFEDCRQFGRGK